MTDTAEISDTAIRQHVLTRADAFCKAHDYSLSRIGDEAVKDSKFLARVRGGKNFTIDTYQRVLDWMDAAERERAA
jgi:hypothetical protein